MLTRKWYWDNNDCSTLWCVRQFSVEVIQTTDPTTAQEMFNTNDVNGGQAVAGGSDVASTNTQQNTQNGTVPVTGQSAYPAVPSASGSVGPSTQQNIRRNAYVKITEQPASKSLRFRYECEGRSAGSIPGVCSTPENKTFPSIQVVGYKGRAVVVVSCVTKDAPYR